MSDVNRVLVEMAGELRAALIEVGLDPKFPPDSSKPPSVEAFAEYKRRGGVRYNDLDAFTAALVEEVGND